MYFNINKNIYRYIILIYFPGKRGFSSEQSGKGGGLAAVEATPWPLLSAAIYLLFLIANFDFLILILKEKKLEEIVKSILFQKSK